MPRRARRPCATAGCPELVDHGHCPAHAGERMRRYNASRGSPAQHGYDSAWKRAAAAFLEANPFCVDRVLPDGHANPRCRVFATEVDHEKPHKGDHALFWDRSNWRPRCKPCHSRKTASRDGGFGR